MMVEQTVTVPTFWEGIMGISVVILVVGCVIGGLMFLMAWIDSM